MVITRHLAALMSAIRVAYCAMITMNKWTVWVGGGEMSSNLLSHSQALKIANVWKHLGYDDVVIESVAADE